MPIFVGAALGTAFLFVFYRAVKVRWPASYFGSSDVSVYAITASPLRYAAFRFAPVYATAVFVATSVSRAKSNGAAAAIALGAIHAISTNGLALVGWARATSPTRRAQQALALLRLLVLGGLLVVAAAAAATYELFEPVIPQVRELAATLWTALFAGVIGAYIVQLSRRDAATDSDLLEQSLNEIPLDLRQYAVAVAIDADADPALVLAVMAVENLQRPPWFRALERVKGRVVARGTYGIMQALADRPLSDRESIDAVISRFAAESVLDEAYEDVMVPDSGKLADFGKAYNGSRAFNELLTTAYSVGRDALDREGGLAADS